MNNQLDRWLGEVYIGNKIVGNLVANLAIYTLVKLGDNRRPSLTLTETECSRDQE